MHLVPSLVINAGQFLVQFRKKVRFKDNIKGSEYEKQHRGMLLLLATFLCIHGTALVHAWGYAGHQLIASTASNFLSTDAKSQIDSILLGQSLSSIAAWADSIKWQARYKFTSELHYINSPDDDPPRTCQMNWVAPGEQEVIAAIYNYTNILLEAADHSWEQSEALRFLVHFISDAHQPLHCKHKYVYHGT